MSFIADYYAVMWLVIAEREREDCGSHCRGTGSKVNGSAFTTPATKWSGCKRILYACWPLTS